MRVIDLSGRKFGRLTVLYRVENDRHNKAQWLCECECGARKIIKGQSLVRGATTSCGCFNREVSSRRGPENTQYSHGGYGTRLYHIWCGMKRRCFTKSNKDYPRYGGRGIIVCEEWRDNFEAFRDWSFANGYRGDLTIDRIDNDGPYAPWNCRWATGEKQANNRRCTLELTVGTETLSLADWSRKTGVSLGTIYGRYRKGWLPHEIIYGRNRKEFAPKSKKGKNANGEPCIICYRSKQKICTRKA